MAEEFWRQFELSGEHLLVFSQNPRYASSSVMNTFVADLKGNSWNNLTDPNHEYPKSLLASLIEVEKLKKKLNVTEEVVAVGVGAEEVVAVGVVPTTEEIEENKKKLKQRVAEKLEAKKKRNADKWENQRDAREDKKGRAYYDNLANSMKGTGLI